MGAMIGAPRRPSGGTAGACAAVGHPFPAFGGRLPWSRTRDGATGGQSGCSPDSTTRWLFPLFPDERFDHVILITASRSDATAAAKGTVPRCPWPAPPGVQRAVARGACRLHEHDADHGLTFRPGRARLGRFHPVWCVDVACAVSACSNLLEALIGLPAAAACGAAQLADAAFAATPAALGGTLLGVAAAAVVLALCGVALWALLMTHMTEPGPFPSHVCSALCNFVL